MRKLLGLFVVLILMNGCGSSEEKRQDEKEDQQTVAEQKTVEESALKFETVLMDLFESPAKSNSFRIGERMNLTVQNMTGFIARSGFFELGLKLEVIDENDSTIIAVNDLFEVGTHKFPMADPVNLSFHVDFFKPYQANKSYTIGMFIWDKVGGKHIQLSQKVNLLPHQENGFIQMNGNIPIDHIITYRNEKVYTGNTYFQDENLFFNIALGEKYLKSRPAIVTKSAVYNKAGEIILESSESATMEEDAPPFNNYVILKKDKYPVGTYRFEQSIKDAKTGNEVTIVYPFDITKTPE